MDALPQRPPPTDFAYAPMFPLGASACPPCHSAIMVGGTSAELTLKTVELASTRRLDRLPTQGSKAGHAFRDLDLERQVHALTGSFGIGVSCSADRRIRAKVTPGGIFLERLEADPARFLPDATDAALGGEVVARDIAHARFRQRLDRGEGLPDYLNDHPVHYAGPAKGNRARAVRDACQAHGGFHLGPVGGAAARLAQDCIRHVETLDYPGLGVEVEDFPAFIVIDDRGHDFFEGLA